MRRPIVPEVKLARLGVEEILIRLAVQHSTAVQL
jgi:hypothetical protein